MKKCPKCGEYIGDSVNECFNCHYHYSYGRIIKPNEIKNERIKSEKMVQQEIEKKEILEKQKQEQICKNPLFEYETVIINDNTDGTVDEFKLQTTLREYSEGGWRLHTIFTNEIGKTTSAVSVGYIGGGINATIEQTVLIFERCIKQ